MTGEAKAPPNFPDGIPVGRRTYSNWALSIVVRFVWVAQVSSEEDCVTLANWAAREGWTLRPFGRRHTFSPITLDPHQAPDAKVLLVDTRGLPLIQKFQLVDGVPAATFSPNVTMDQATLFLQNQDNGNPGAAPGYGFMNYPAPGGMSLGGMLAIGGHGTGWKQNDFDFNGCLSNLILSFRAIVSDPATGRYGVRVFQRTDPDADVLILHLGRAFITEVTLRVVPNYWLDVVNSYPRTSETFGADPTHPSSLQFLLKKYGRVEAIWFPFTDRPWVKWWRVLDSAPTHPVRGPYNYPWMNNVPLWASKALAAGLRCCPCFTPMFSRGNIRMFQCFAPPSKILTGTSRDLLLYYEEDALRFTAAGFGFQITSDQVQSVCNTFWKKYAAMLEAYRARRSFPINQPTEIRLTTTDRTTDLPPGSRPPALSICRQGNASADTILWIQCFTMAMKDTYAFFEELETFYIETFGPQASGILRPEWSKGWAFTSKGPGTNLNVIRNVIPRLFNQPDPNLWERATKTFEKHDAARIYTDPLLDALFPFST